LNDPNAPEPTTIAIAASAFVLDDAGRLLVIRRADNGLYALPGGRHELGETVTNTAVRETLEETGVTIDVNGLIGIYSNPAHVVATADGEVRQEFSICFRGRPVSG
jgi:ADP-ribose pyrophosphatase YjhB (NUDIX family)